MENNNLVKAQNIFKNICKFMDSKEWHYESNEESLIIKSGARGEDLPMEFTIGVEPRRQLIYLHSHLPFHIVEEKITDVAMAICIINYSLVNGCFDFDVSEGTILFRLTTSFMDSLIGNELFNYMIQCSLACIDEYNDKLLMVSKGMMDLKAFYEEVSK